MHWNNRGAPVWVPDDVVAAPRSNQHEPGPLQRGENLAASQSAGIGSYCNALNTDELCGMNLDPCVKAGFDRLARALHQDIQRLGLRVTAAELGNGGDVPPLGVAFDDNIELPGCRCASASCGHMRPFYVGRGREPSAYFNRSSLPLRFTMFL
jgi:hypothetical protein